MRQFKLQGLATCICMVAMAGLVAVLYAADDPIGITDLTADGATGPQLGEALGGGTVEVTVTGTVFFNAIQDPPLSDVQAGDAGSLSFLVHSDNFLDGAGLNTRGYVIDQSSFVLTLGSTEIGLADPFPAGETPYFTLADGIPVADRFWVSTSVNSPAACLSQDPFEADVDLGYTGDTLDSLDILAALGTYDFDGLTSFAFNLWAIFPDNVAMGLDFEQMTIAEPDDGGRPEKITICHIPPDDPDNAHTITISVRALPAHLAHGDTIGPCDDGGCQSNGDCAENEYCAKEVGDCDGPGVCTVKPEFCTLEYDPVCGCDGVTYSNACMAAAAGVNVAFEGPCEPPLGRCCQGGITGVVCLVNTEEECMSSGQFISWEEGLDCPDGDATCAAPPNDHCADAICIADGDTVIGSTVDSTGADITSCAFSDTNDVWYVTNYQGGLMAVSLCGSSYDTTLALFDACNGNELACNDDSCGLQSEVTFEAIVGGFEVLIRVSGFNNATGDFTLNVTGGGGGCPPPASDGPLTVEQVYQILLPDSFN